MSLIIFLVKVADATVLANLGRFGHGRVGHGHGPLEVLATENIQGGRFGYIICLKKSTYYDLT